MSAQSSQSTTIFFATDLHGSETCFKKFLQAGRFYAADLLFLGGDYGGKELVLFARVGSSVRTFEAAGERRTFTSTDAFSSYSLWCKTSGRLMREVEPEVVETITPVEYRRLFDTSLIDTLDHWAGLAREAYQRDHLPIYVIPGNDDPPETDKCFSVPPFNFLHRRVAKLPSGIAVLGWGGSNPTPWHTAREHPEDRIRAELEETLGSAPNDLQSTILFTHPPPFTSGLDLAPEISPRYSYRLSLGAPKMKPIGSVAVREFITKHDPMLGLFGHVHEGRGHQRIGKTLCINPGSAFHVGRLLGCLIKISNNRVIDFQFTEG